MQTNRREVNSMVTDPYRVLGVNHGATPDEIKKAYRQKAKECHPDLHPDDPNATKKMNEVNEAYDMLMHPEKYQARQQQSSGGYQQTYSNPFTQQQQRSNPYGGYQGGSGGNSYDGGYGPFGGGFYDFDDLFGFGSARRSSTVPPPQEMPFDSMEVRTAIRAINGGRWQEAIGILSSVPSTGRNARWHYLMGLSQQGAGNTMMAQEEMQRASQMEPNNALYHQLLQQYRQAGQSYQQRSQGWGFNMGAMDPTRWCMRICLINLFCNFCCRCL